MVIPASGTASGSTTSRGRQSEAGRANGRTGRWPATDVAFDAGSEPTSLERIVHGALAVRAANAWDSVDDHSSHPVYTYRDTPPY